jgi:hypothetical protein
MMGISYLAKGFIELIYFLICDLKGPTHVPR